MRINTKAFTLIELLAVIVILAIIVLIATPIVLNIIRDSKENAQLRSAEMYLDAVEQAVMREKMTNTNFRPKKCEIKDKMLYCNEETEEFKVEVNGEVPESGTIAFTHGKINKVSLTYSNKKTVVKNTEGSLEYKIKVCKLVSDEDDSETITTGDEIECAKEYFRVIENDGETISMLTKYNLNVGSNTYLSSIIGIQNENVVGYKSGMTTYGNIAFSATNYWYDTTNSTYKTEYKQGESGYYYVYDSNSNLYGYIEDYETYLKGKGVDSASATVISFEQLEKLGCSKLNLSCSSSPHSWVYYTTYWSGSVNGNNDLWTVYSNINLDYFAYSFVFRFGVRPVVNILINEI